MRGSLAGRPTACTSAARRFAKHEFERALARHLATLRMRSAAKRHQRPHGSVAQSAKQRSLTRCERSMACGLDRKSTRLNSSHLVISYAVFCLKKKNKI